MCDEDYNMTDSVFGSGEEAITVTLLDEPIELGLAGMVYSPRFKEKIPIVVDDTSHDEQDYDYSALGYSEEKQFPRIILWREVFLDLQENSNMALMILFHELGHYIHQDVLIKEYSFAVYDKERKESITDGDVSLAELRADAFAAEYLGTDAVIEGLRMLIDSTIQIYGNNGNYDPADVKLTIDELTKRIAALADEQSTVAE